MLELFIVRNERNKHLNVGREDTHSASVRPRRATRSPIRSGIGSLKVLVGIVHMVLEVPLSAVPLILHTEKLGIVLRVLLAHMIKPQAGVSKLIR